MTDIADEVTGRDEDSAPFTVAATAIPAGVRCPACGRLHLPHRLRGLNQRSPGPAGADEVILLSCPRCGHIGPLDVDPGNPEHLDVRDTIASQARGPAHPAMRDRTTTP